MNIYTGIGSRETPAPVLKVMFSLARELAKSYHILRSGGAVGADTAFERGCIEGEGRKEIYLPWKGFNNNLSNLYTIPKEAFDIARKYHPAWDRLSDAGQKLMARNSQQILGEKLDSPTDFVVCWTSDGKISGGTGQALRIAEDHCIKIYNLFNPKDYTLLQDILLTQRNL